VAVAAPFGYELFLNRRLRCRDDLEKHFGIPVLAQLGPLPTARFDGGGDPTLSPAQHACREGYMKSRLQGTRALRTFGIGLTMQALLSGANFAVGLILIRRTSDLQYSFYVLAHQRPVAADCPADQLHSAVRG